MKIFRRISMSVLIVLSLYVGFCYGQSVAERSFNVAEQSFTKGIEYASQGKFAEAKAEFEKAIDKGNLHAEPALKVIADLNNGKIGIKTAVHLFKGVFYLNDIASDIADKAVANFNIAIEASPKYAMAYVFRGVAYSSHVYNPNYNQAISDCNRALKLDPKLTDAYLTRGMAYLDKGEHQQAFSDYNEAIRLDPNNALPYFYRGSVYFKLGQFQHAIEDFTRTIQLEPNYAWAYSYRGGAYKRLGKNDLACNDFQKLCDLGICGSIERAKERGDCPK